MRWLRSMFNRIFDTKSVKELRSQQADLKVMVAMAKHDESIEASRLRRVMAQAREEYKPSPLAAGFGWRRHD